MFSKKPLIALFSIAILTILAGFGARLVFAQIGWYEPTGTPPEDNEIPLWIKNGNDLYHTTGGNVGLGTISPGYKLDVRGNSYGIYGSGSIAGIYGYGAYGVYAYGTQYGVFSAAGDNYFSGNVGIGTTSLNSKLTLVGDLRVYGSAASTYAYKYSRGASVYRPAGVRCPCDISTNTADCQAVWNTNTDYGSSCFDLYNQGRYGYQYNRSPGTVALYVSSSDNVGIGTTVPVAKLDVAGVAQIMDGILTYGKIGVGTDAPKGTLHAVGDLVLGLDENNKKFIFHSRTNGNGDFLQITNDNSAGDWDWNQGITLKRGGFVGIGTTSPGQKLTVVGTIESRSGGFKFPDGTTQITASGDASILVGTPGYNYVNPGTTNYFSFGATTLTTTEMYVQTPMPRTGTLSRFYIRVFLNLHNGNTIFTIRKNGVDTAVTITVPALQSGIFSDTTNFVSFNAGDLLSIKYEVDGKPGTIATTSFTAIYR